MITAAAAGVVRRVAHIDIASGGQRNTGQIALRGIWNNCVDCRGSGLDAPNAENAADKPPTASMPPALSCAAALCQQPQRQICCPPLPIVLLPLI